MHGACVAAYVGKDGVREAECLATGWTPPFSDRGFVVLSASFSAWGGQRVCQ